MMFYIYIASIILLAIFARGVLLAFLSKFLDIIIFPLNVISVIIRFYKLPYFWKLFNSYLFSDALETDIFLHVNYRSFWNLTSSSGGTKFGVVNMTLSAMIGLKKEEKTLIGLLWFFYYFLYAIDYTNWKNGGHCKSAFQLWKTNKENE